MATHLRKTQSTRTAVEPVVLPMRRRRIRAALTLALFAASCGNAAAATRNPVTPSDTPARTVVAVLQVQPAPAQTAQPNFVLIVTDDQSIGTLKGMPNVQRLMNHGTNFTQAIVSNPLCCPSRATILTGNYSHTTGVYTNEASGDGGFRAFRDHGNETETIAYKLDVAGYRTGLFGKYLNHTSPTDLRSGGMPLGWDSWHGFTGSNPKYYDYNWVDYEGSAPTFTHYGSAPSDYSTNVAGQFAVDFVRQSVGEPFLAVYSPYGPHGRTIPGPGDGDIQAPANGGWKSPAFNEDDVSDKPPYMRHLERADPHRHDALWDRTFGTLASVDRWIGQLMDAAPANTVFVFLSDNGYMWSDHRWHFKLVPYERSIRVPMVVTVPGGPTQNSPALVSNADVAPTILDLAGLDPTGVDGKSLRGIVDGTGGRGHRTVPLEHRDYPSQHSVPSYCGVRTSRFTYVRYGSGFEELYNLKRDPYQMSNAANRNQRVLRRLRNLTEEVCR